MESSFSKRLKEYRLDKNFSQQQLAILLGASKQNISDWENGKSETDFSTVIALAKILDVTVGQLLGAEE